MVWDLTKLRSFVFASFYASMRNDLQLWAFLLLTIRGDLCSFLILKTRKETIIQAFNFSFSVFCHSLLKSFFFFRFQILKFEKIRERKENRSVFQSKETVLWISFSPFCVLCELFFFIFSFFLFFFLGLFCVQLGDKNRGQISASTSENICNNGFSAPTCLEANLKDETNSKFRGGFLG